MWFLGGHILESTFLNLELYFEHRNYLPSYGVFFGVCYLAITIVRKIQSKFIGSSLIAIYIILIFSVFILETRNWFQPVLQAAEWVRLHPHSDRALNNLATVYIKFEEYEQATTVLMEMEKNKPDSIFPAIQLIRIHDCIQHVDHTDDAWLTIINRAEQARPYGQRLIAALDLLLVDALKGRCKENTLSYFDKLLQQLIENRNYSYLMSYLYEFSATINLYNRDYNSALNNINKSIEIRPDLSNYRFKIQLLRILNRDDEINSLILQLKEKSKEKPVKFFMYNNIIESIKKDQI